MPDRLPPHAQTETSSRSVTAPPRRMLPGVAGGRVPRARLPPARQEGRAQGTHEGARKHVLAWAQGELTQTEKWLAKAEKIRPFKYSHQSSFAYIGSDKAIADLPFFNGNVSRAR